MRWSDGCMVYLKHSLSTVDRLVSKCLNRYMDWISKMLYLSIICQKSAMCVKFIIVNIIVQPTGQTQDNFNFGPQLLQKLQSSQYLDTKLGETPNISNSRTAKFWLLSTLLFVVKNMNNILKTHTVHARLVHGYVLSKHARLLGRGVFTR